MKIIRGIHSAYTFLVFVVLFFIFFPLLGIPIAFRSQHHLVGAINRWWARFFFGISLFPFKTEYRFKPQKGQSYIFCPNHFSYLDIPTMGLNKVNTIFVGKNDMENIPVFGYMYHTLHITVNRSSYRSRARSLEKAREAIRDGFNLGFFPEGGIRLSKYPEMVEFKDGAFKVAAENNIPIVPITMPDNYKILPDDDLLNIRRKTCHIIFHEPIWPSGDTDDDVKKLRTEVFRVIQKELNNRKAD